MDPIEQFQREKRDRLSDNLKNDTLRATANRFLLESIACSYSYNFEWLSRPIIQYPQDIVAVQELIWRVRPDLIVETGVAHGGSLILSASMLAMLDYCDAVSSNTVLDPRASNRQVVGIDIDIRRHNRAAIEAHPLAHKINLIQGSSISAEIVERVRALANGHRRILVLLDSNHTHDHVFGELSAYAPLVSPGSYCVVFDTMIENFPKSTYPDRQWGPGNSPMTAVQRFLATLADEGVTAMDGGVLCFETDQQMDSKLLVSVAPNGYLRRVEIKG